MIRSCRHCGERPRKLGYAWCEPCLGYLRQAERKLARSAHKPFRPKLGSALSPRQREVLSMMMAGQSVREIAAVMGVDDGTVSEHKRRIFLRTGTTNDVQLGIWAASNFA